MVKTSMGSWGTLRPLSLFLTTLAESPLLALLTLFPGHPLSQLPETQLLCDCFRPNLAHPSIPVYWLQGLSTKVRLGGPEGQEWTTGKGTTHQPVAGSYSGTCGPGWSHW